MKHDDDSVEERAAFANQFEECGNFPQTEKKTPQNAKQKSTIFIIQMIFIQFARNWREFVNILNFLSFFTVVHSLITSVRREMKIDVLRKRR